MRHCPRGCARLQVLRDPIAEAHEAWARAVVERLRGAGMRVASDFRRETLAKRIAEAHAGAVPFVAVIGGREVEARSASIRAREQELRATSNRSLADLVRECASPFGAELH